MNTTLSKQITKTASKQTFFTIRYLVDRERVADAYRAYAYFRWVDDTLDAGTDPNPERSAFLKRQRFLLDQCYRGLSSTAAGPEESMLIELVRNDHERNSGLRSYLYSMMQVMEFDAHRRGQLISQVELNDYTRWLATAVTEAMHYFIGHDTYSPHDETRYLAVTAAHISHMLRDTFDDVQAGYYNVPREVLAANRIGPQDIHNKAYRAWVRGRVQMARDYFKTGREYLARVEEPRCRLAGFAYSARFEWLLDTIEREDFCLRPEYQERKSFGTGIRMGLETLFSMIHGSGGETLPQTVASQSLRKL